MCGPWCPFLPTFLACSVSCFALLILAFSSACSLSVPLCLGISRSISSRQRSSSSGVCARRYSSSAFLYCGVRLAGMNGLSRDFAQRGNEGTDLLLGVQTGQTDPQQRLTCWHARGTNGGYKKAPPAQFSSNGHGAIRVPQHDGDDMRKRCRLDEAH